MSAEITGTVDTCGSESCAPSYLLEETMPYPGQIRVTVIRETRAVEYAK